jgi:hypothetical protein
LKVSRVYQEKAKTAGETVEIIIPPNAGHFELVMPSSNAFVLVQKTILAMIPSEISNETVTKHE